jgi:iron complex outermembrane recepter protein
MTRSRWRKLNRNNPGQASWQLASALLGSAGAAFAQQAPPVATEPQGLEEIVVTAQKRSENLQDVPISVEALDAKRLEDLHITDFDSFAKYLPSVSFQTIGPSQAQIYFRGVTNGSDGLRVGSQPMVGVYVDEQPVTAIDSALDIHVYDMERIEALAGPQGTLFGASSLAGTVRYITNKPDTSGTYAGYDLSAINVDHGGNGEKAEAYVNFALTDNAAIRLVGFSERDPGYINNVAGPVEVYPTSGVVRDNTPYRKNDYNNVGTEGGRAGLKIDLDDRWTILPTLMYQKQGANGSFAYEQPLGYLNVATYEPMRNDDQWYQAALTIQGKISNLDLTYSGAYMRRTIQSVVDYSDYSFAYDTAYANNPSYFGDLFENNAGQLISPAQKLVSYDLLSYHTHELRLASQKDAPLRFVLGLFYEVQGDDDIYRYDVAGLADSLSITGQPGVHYMQGITRRDVDRAVFTDLTYDLTSSLALTGGIRVFDYDSTAVGFFGFNSNYTVGEALCATPPTPATAGPVIPCQNVNANTSGSKYTDRITLNYKLGPDKMIYATYSTGFREGGFNRIQNVPPYPPDYRPDYLTNYELGWKTSWAANTVRFNGALFLEDWKDAQFSISGPYSITETINAGAAQTQGVESSLEWLLANGLTLISSGTYLWKHDLTQNACIAFSTEPDCGGSANVAAPAGTPMPVAPAFKANVSLRYEFDIAGLKAFAQGAGFYQSSSRSLLAVADEGVAGPMPGYGTFDISFGAGKGNWNASLSAENLFGSHGEISRYLVCSPSYCTTPYIVPVKPRTLTLQFGQKF